MTRRRGINRRTLVLALAALATAGAAGCSDDDWRDRKLVWEDQFDGPAGQLPDSTRWGFDVGEDWGNNQLEYDTDRPENASLDGSGNLAIVARKEPYLGRNFTSARITTRGLLEMNEGRFEARIRLPVGQGMWPAFWLLGANISTVGWPACGEIDIMEYRGQEPRISIGSLHGPGYSGGAAITREFDIGVNLNEDFHVFAVEWDPDRITWYVDDTPYRTVTLKDLEGRGLPWVFDHPFYMILNLAVGGDFVGPPNSSTVFPQTMLIDWVRVYHGQP